MKRFKLDKQLIAATLKKRWPWLLAEVFIFAFALTLDLTIKDYLANLLEYEEGSGFTLIKGFMDITFSMNTGAGFGSFKDATVPLSVITGIVIFGILVYLVLRQKDAEALRIPLVFIAAGGLGNLVDRIMLGYVRDFFEFTFMNFAIFNIADVFVTVGAVWLVIYLIYMLVDEGRKTKKKLAEEQAKQATCAENADGAEGRGDDNCSQEQSPSVQERESGAFTIEMSLDPSDNDSDEKK